MIQLSWQNYITKIGLLPGDLKDNIRAQDTRNKKSEYFLDNAIKPSVTSDVGTNILRK